MSWLIWNNMLDVDAYVDSDVVCNESCVIDENSIREITHS